MWTCKAVPKQKTDGDSSGSEALAMQLNCHDVEY